MVVQKTISGRIATLALVAATTVLGACGAGEEVARVNSALVKAETERAQALKAASEVSTRNAELTTAKQRAEVALAAERTRVAELSTELAKERMLRRKTEVKLAHKVDEVKGAQKVAGTAVYHAYLNGSQTKKAAIKAEPKKKT